MMTVKMYFSILFIKWGLKLCPFPEFQKDLQLALIDVATKYEGETSVFCLISQKISAINTK